jgi:TonB family protein
LPPRREPQTETPRKPVFEDIDHARARAKSTPDPPQDQLARTSAGIARRSGSTRVSFCIGIDGRTNDVRTRKSAGDVDVDRICREAVARWRFEPVRVDGEARTSCSEVVFSIAFE